jgi:hypothetical protein
MPAPSRRSRMFLESQRVSLAIVFALTVFSLVGCGSKSTGPSAEERAEAQVLAEEGFDLLIQALIDTSVSASELNSCRAKFEEALALDPKNGEANLGLALTELVLLGYDPEILALIEGPSAALMGLGRVAVDVPPGVRPLASMLPAVDRSGLFVTSLLDWFNVDLTRIARTGALTPGQVQDVMQTVILPKLETVIECLGTIENLDEWQMILTGAAFGMEEYQLEIDQTDIFVLDMLVHLMKAPFHFMVAYNIDIPDMKDTTAVKAAFNQTDGPFLSLRTGGANNMKAFRLTLLDGVARMSSFLLSLNAETDDQTDDLIKIGSSGSGVLTPTDIDSLAEGISDFVEALSGPMTITGDFDNDAMDESVTVNLSVIFTNPIPDIKQLMPDYYWDSQFQGWYWAGYPENDFSRFVYPDASLHGILPDFAPGGDAMFKAVFNIDTFPSEGPFLSLPNLVSLMNPLGRIVTRIR